MNLLAVSSFYEISSLKNELKKWSVKLKNSLESEVIVSDFNSVFNDLLNPSSTFQTNKNGINFILFRTEDFLVKKSDKGKEILSLRLVKEHIDRFIESLIEYLTNKRTSKLMIFETPSKRVNEDISEEIERRISKLKQEYSNKIGYINISKYKGREVFDETMEELASIPYTEEYFKDLGRYIYRKYWVNMIGSQFKVFVVDCDNTLWKGILNESGINKLQFNDERQVLREKLKRQIDCGRLICINSANDIDSVKEVFKIKSKQLKLTQNEITAWKVNWQPKFKNLIEIADEVGVGLDSLVFIDDDETNIGSCRQQVPQVLSLLFKVQNLSNIWVLDELDFVTETDKNRNEMYKANVERNSLKTKTIGSYVSFLSGLEVEVEVKEISCEDVSRVSQLTQRSNRFNCTTERMTEVSVEEYISKDNSKCYKAKVLDKFGSYGLCGVLFVRVESTTVVLDNCLLSCRALNRGVEIKLLNKIVEENSKAEELLVKFKSSEKNNLAKEFLDRVVQIVDGKRENENYIFKIERIASLTVEKYYERGELKTKQEEREIIKDTKQQSNDKFKLRNDTLSEVFSSKLESSIEESTSVKNESKGSVLELVKECFEEVVKVKLSKDEEQVPLMSLGMNSLQAVQFVAKLRKIFPQKKTKLTMALPFSYPTLLKISQFLDTEDETQADTSTHTLQNVKASGSDESSVVVTSMACRFSGGINDPVEFWKFLEAGKNGRKEVDESRWSREYFPEDCGSEVNFMHSIEDVDVFDNKLFGISDSEAKLMDPQQRLVLTVAYEALFRSDLNLDKFAREDKNRFQGSNIGVYLAYSQNDWPYICLEQQKKSTYSFSGKTSSIASGRVSFTFGLTGPSMNVDTACSSSLVALKMASEAVKSGECEAALVVGVNLNLHPETYVQLSRANQLASDGFCKAFDNSANGFARGEGCGAILIQREADVCSVDSCLARVKTVAVNNDGQSSSLAAPNGSAQSKCLQKGLIQAGLCAEDVCFIETHGAGTKLGDTIEFESIKSVFGSKENNLVLGAVKTNIGHLEAAAGMAGLIKTVLVLMMNKAPANLHLNQLSDTIDVKDCKITFGKSATELVKNKNIPAVGGVSAFGMSGTNSFALLEQMSTKDVEDKESFKIVPNSVCPKHFPWSVKVKDKKVEETQEKQTDFESVLCALIKDVCTISGEIDLNSTFANLGVDSLAGIELSQMIFEKFPSLQEDHTTVSLIYDLPTPRDIINKLHKHNPSTVEESEENNTKLNKKIGIVFTGQGSQYFGMGKDLYNSNQIFKKHLDKVNRIFINISEEGESLLDIMFKSSDETKVENTKYAQIAIFAYEYSLYQTMVENTTLEESDFVLIGHSIGEFVAATVSGVFDLESAVKIVWARGKCISACPPLDGSMLALRLEKTKVEDTLLKLTTEEQHKVSIAAVNGSKSTVLSGSKAILEKFLSIVDQKVTKTYLTVSHAFHSPLIKEGAVEFGKSLTNIEFHEPTIPIISELNGQLLSNTSLNKDYWQNQMLGTVNFYGALKTMLNSGVNEIYEVGPQPKLVNLMKSIAKESVRKVNIEAIVKKNMSEYVSVSEFCEKLSVVEVDVPERCVLQQRHKLTQPEPNRNQLALSSRKFESLYEKLFDESTLLQRMEDRLFSKLMNKWENPNPAPLTRRERVQTIPDNISLATESTGANLFQTYCLDGTKGLVFVVDGLKKVTKSDLQDYIENNYTQLNQALKKHGSVLFRNCRLESATDFRDILRELEVNGYQVRDYLDGISPRSEVIQGIYTSTEYPAHLDMALHNEMSYNPIPPDLISFFCVTPAKANEGRTPLASSRTLLQELSAETVELFKSKGLKYIVNSPSEGKGVGVSWQQMYDTKDKNIVENICSQLDIEIRWNKDESLTTFRTAEATRMTSKGEVWFNHSHLFHPSDLPKQTQLALKRGFGDKKDSYPKYCMFADDTEIPSSCLDEIRLAQKKCKISFDWKAGDMLVIDNFQLCHGRQAFSKTAEPKRKILASMLFTSS